MKITFEIDFSDLRTMSKENVLDFLHTQLVCEPLDALCEELAKSESDYPEPAWRESLIMICRDNCEVGRRLMDSMKIDE